MTKNPLDGLVPITIVVPEKVFDKLLELLDSTEPADLSKLKEVMSRPSRIESRPDELR